MGDSRLNSEISWAPGPKFRQHGPDEYVVLNAGRSCLIGGVVISGCGCCRAHASKVRLSVSLQEKDGWIDRGDHECCDDHGGPQVHGDRGCYDVIEIEPTLAQFVKINPREWRDGENHAALRCALLIVKDPLVVTLQFTEHGVTVTDLTGDIILEKAFSDALDLPAISSSVKAITKHDGPVMLLSADGDVLA